MPPPQKNSLKSRLLKFKAFTLSEILISLSIIGIIAALTIPTLFNKYEKHTTVVKLKKGYSMFANVFERAIGEHGAVEDWPELAIYVPDRPSEDCGMYNGAAEKCVVPFVNKYFSGIKSYEYKLRPAKVYPIKNLRGTNPMMADSNQLKWFYLPDGTCFLLSLNYDASLFSYIFYDINGDSKPNIIGKDIFVFDFDAVRSYKFSMEQAWENMNNPNFRQRITTQARTACSKTAAAGYYNAFSCGALIQYDGWQIKDDYPW